MVCTPTQNLLQNYLFPKDENHLTSHQAYWMILVKLSPHSYPTIPLNKGSNLCSHIGFMSYQLMSIRQYEIGRAHV